MSFWYESKKKDIDITEDGKEIHIWLGDDESGNIWASVKVEDIKELLKTIKK